MKKKSSWGWSISSNNPERKYFLKCLSGSRLKAKKGGHKPCLASLEQLYRAWTGRCVCCGVEEGEERHLHMDHCHKTGKFRGFICGRCNRVLGQANDDCAVLTCAIKYLSLYDS